MRTYVFLGDSVTEGCFALYPTSYGFDTYRDYNAVYHTQLAPALEAKYGTCRIINSGISGDNSFQALKRLDKDVLAYKPDCVVVCYGLNDAFHPLERYEESLDRIFTRLSHVEHVVFMTPNRMNSYVHPNTLPCSMKIAEKTAQFQNDGTFDRCIYTARRVARMHNIPVCDAYAYWTELEKNGTDTTALLANYINHPNAKMHGEFARLLEPML